MKALNAKKHGIKCKKTYQGFAVFGPFETQFTEFCTTAQKAWKMYADRDDVKAIAQYKQDHA